MKIHILAVRPVHEIQGNEESAHIADIVDFQCLEGNAADVLSMPDRPEWLQDALEVEAFHSDPTKGSLCLLSGVHPIHPGDVFDSEEGPTPPSATATETRRGDAFISAFASEDRIWKLLQDGFTVKFTDDYLIPSAMVSLENGRIVYGYGWSAYPATKGLHIVLQENIERMYTWRYMSYWGWCGTSARDTDIRSEYWRITQEAIVCHRATRGIASNVDRLIEQKTLYAQFTLAEESYMRAHGYEWHSHHWVIRD